jgi:hypothetical protein
MQVVVFPFLMPERVVQTVHLFLFQAQKYKYLPLNIEHGVINSKIQVQRSKFGPFFIKFHLLSSAFEENKYSIEVNNSEFGEKSFNDYLLNLND